ncbi:MAG: DUF3710 domain-containing protein [Rhodococcus sp. (in: high G+C Gram-positive bacteria)]|uniref:DUF3710 domain-containing protein n=1 Tax=Rhodococcus sp. TaxID=1831 RepID=UPI003BB05EC2
MSTIGTGMPDSSTYVVNFGALSVPYFPGHALSVVTRDGHADTVIVRTVTGNIALNLYAANPNGAVPGYLGSCLRHLIGENVDSGGVESISDTEIGGTTADGTHVRFLSRTGPHWLLRGAVRAHRHAAAVDIALTRRMLAGTVVHAPRHYLPGTVLELDANPTWTAA